MSGYLSDLATGEVLTDEQAAERAGELAREYVRVTEAIAEQEADLRPLRETAARLEGALRACMRVGQSVEAGGASVVLSPPPRRPAVRVDAAVATAHQEVLLEHDLGVRVPVYKPPTAAEVKRAYGVLAAAGVPMDALLPDPGPGTPVLEVVVR